MDDRAFQLIKSTLRTIPGYKEHEFKNWYQTSFLDANSSDGSLPNYAIVDYDIDRNPVIILPDIYSHFVHRITNHLNSTKQNDPWGMLDDSFIVLKLSDHPHSRIGRVMVFSVAFISVLLKKLFPLDTITPAEQKTLLQSLSGFSLKESANLDQVSHETKKSQLKSVFQKTKIRRQQVLSNFLISHLLLDVAAKTSRQNRRAEHDEIFFQYVDQFMGKYARASVIQEPSGKRIRLIEIGDPAGTPVVCIHHLGLINFNEQEIDEIFRQGIRLICPLRYGALGRYDETLTPVEQFEYAIDGINLAVSLIHNKKVTIIGMLSGCLYAIQYLKLHPDKVKDLIFFGAPYKPSVAKKSHAPLKRNLHKIASDDDFVLRTTVSYLISKIDQPDQLRAVIEESNNNGRADSLAITELFLDQKQVKAMQFRLKHSTESITNDLRTQAISDWAPLLSGKSHPDVHFIHGIADELIPIDNIAVLVGNNANYHLHVIKTAGNWVFGKFTKQTFSFVRSILDKTSNP